MCTLGDYYAANPFTSLLTNKHTCSGGSLKLWLFFKSWDILLKTYYFIERVVDHLPLMTYGLKLSLEA